MLSSPYPNHYYLSAEEYASFQRIDLALAEAFYLGYFAYREVTIPDYPHGTICRVTEEALTHFIKDAHIQTFDFSRIIREYLCSYGIREIPNPGIPNQIQWLILDYQILRYQDIILNRYQEQYPTPTQDGVILLNSERLTHVISQYTKDILDVHRIMWKAEDEKESLS